MYLLMGPVLCHMVFTVHMYVYHIRVPTCTHYIISVNLSRIVVHTVVLQFCILHIPWASTHPISITYLILAGFTSLLHVHTSLSFQIGCAQVTYILHTVKHAYSM